MSSSSPDLRNVGYWGDRWDKDEIRFHKDFVQPCLTQHYQKLLLRGSSSAENPKPRIFLPLCGKSLDLLWFADKGFQVVGLEAVTLPIEAFFEENNLAYELESIEHMHSSQSKVNCYSARDKDIKLYQLDIFDVSTSLLGGPFDALWDRGSLSAIGLYVEDRGRRYADLMLSLLSPGGRYMIENHHYLGEKRGPDVPGPPSDVPESVLRDLFGHKCEINALEVALPSGSSAEAEIKGFAAAYYIMAMK